MTNHDPAETTPADDDTAENPSAKPDGLGTDGTIPNHPRGIAVGVTDEPSHFNPEEDEDAT